MATSATASPSDFAHPDVLKHRRPRKWFTAMTGKVPSVSAVSLREQLNGGLKNLDDVDAEGYPGNPEYRDRIAETATRHLKEMDRKITAAKERRERVTGSELWASDEADAFREAKERLRALEDEVQDAKQELPSMTQKAKGLRKTLSETRANVRLGKATQKDVAAVKDDLEDAEESVLETEAFIQQSRAVRSELREQKDEAQDALFGVAMQHAAPLLAKQAEIVAKLRDNLKVLEEIHEEYSAMGKRLTLLSQIPHVSKIKANTPGATKNVSDLDTIVRLLRDAAAGEQVSAAPAVA